MAKSARLDRNLVWEIGVVTKMKNSESICGDQCVYDKDRNGATIILSDGLGSGVKANILSTLTSTMLSAMLHGSIPLEEAVSTVAATLPICSVRHLAYATFTIVTAEGRHVRLVQYDNPPAVFLKAGKSQRYSYSVHFVQDKELHESTFSFSPGDCLILFSDGVAEAGRGVTTYDGWPRAEMEDFLARNWTPDVSAQRIAARMLSTVQALDLDELHDDTTIAVLRLRERKPVNLMIGPPENQDDDLGTMRLFFAKEGLHAVCGGTTAKAVAKYLNTRVHLLPDTGSDEVPPMSMIAGVDLVTEGAVTLSVAVELLKDYPIDGMIALDMERRKDGAAKLAEMLMEDATEINLFFGNAANTAQEDTEFSFERKLKLVNELQDILKGAGKKVKLSIV